MLKKGVKENIKNLVRIDSSKVNQIIEKMFDSDHDLTLEALSSTPQEKYDYIKSHLDLKHDEIRVAYRASQVSRSKLRMKYDNLLVTFFDLIC